MPATVHQLLAPPSFSSALRDSEMLLAYVLGQSREWLLIHADARVPAARAARYRVLRRRLRRGEPLAQLIGEQWFDGRPFRVTRDVLIPRPETELLVERALIHARTSDATIIDIGTGSGCIAATLAAELPSAHVLAIDASPAALRIARTNAQRLGVADRITFLHGDLLAPILRRRASVIRHPSFVMTANLPYLTTAEWRALPSSLKRYEPRAAFDGGPDGLAPYRALFTQLRTLNAQGRVAVLLEIDPRRKRQLGALVRGELPNWLTNFHCDLAHRWRVLEMTNARTREP